MLDKPPVQKALAKDFVFIKLYTNQGTKEQKRKVKDLRVRFEGGGANPWYVLLLPDERVMQRFGGALTIPGFLDRLAQAKEKAGRTAKASSGYDDFKAGMDAARTLGKPVFLAFTGGSTCAVSLDNARTVLEQPAVRRARAKDFVFIRLQAGQGDEERRAQVHALRDRFQGAANPWYVFLTPEEVELDRFGGRLTVPGFLERLAQAKEKAGRTAKAK